MRKILLFFLLLSVAAGQTYAQKADKKADRIIEAYLKAIGGKDKINGIEEMLQKLTLKANGQEMKMEVLVSKKNRGYTKMQMMGMEFVIYAYNGDKGFRMNQQMSYDELDKEELEKIKEGKGEILHGLGDYRKLDRKYLGQEELKGKKYDVVEITNNGQASKFYFDPETHLLAAIKVKNPDTGTEITTYFDKYKAFDGILFATEMTAEAGGQTQKITLDEVVINPKNIDPSVFEMPEE